MRTSWVGYGQKSSHNALACLDLNTLCQNLGLLFANTGQEAICGYGEKGDECAGGAVLEECYQQTAHGQNHYQDSVPQGCKSIGSSTPL